MMTPFGTTLLVATLSLIALSLIFVGLIALGGTALWKITFAVRNLVTVMFK